ncbi:flagellar hook-basal body complex protein FliE [Hwanghaeella grinnelliae]|uniref:Flagellar hook-basal body complex protein FliE n=1 Tax=Hwanghaeella grinnelliae TaxID=2500179 RepID=A0A437QJF7_9PROT|nr:flagellar hook-basal body complex protein FliE [Hwanghaeella grinnelliae]RVU34638.1 flagellar hook-basal body complex protein FliE [Hwanghaeella grinnelliae]
MAINPADAAAAYRANATPLPSPSPAGKGDTPAGGSFLDLVKSGVNDAVSANRAAEKLSIDAIAGKADLTEVVTAISHAEATLSTVVRVRDRMISAYQQILRMPI